MQRDMLSARIVIAMSIVVQSGSLISRSAIGEGKPVKQLKKKKIRRQKRRKMEWYSASWNQKPQLCRRWSIIQHQSTATSSLHNQQPTKWKQQWKWRQREQCKWRNGRDKSHTGSGGNRNPNSGGIGTVKAQKGSTQACRCTEWVSMQASTRQFIERGTRVQTSWLRDSVGKYSVLWVLMNFLTHLICLVSSPMCRTWARAMELGVLRLWGIRARTRREVPTTMRSYYYI